MDGSCPYDSPNLSHFLSTRMRKPEQQRMRVYRTKKVLVVAKVGDSNTHVIANNGREYCVYVPSASTCNVHRCGSNPSEYYTLSTANPGLNLRLKKQLGSAGVTVEDSLDLRTGNSSENQILYGTFAHNVVEKHFQQDRDQY